jgi:hypothetical protein
MPVEETPKGQPTLFRILRDVLLSPRTFFAALPSGTGRAVAIAVLVRVISDPLASLTSRFIVPATSVELAAHLVRAPLSAASEGGCPALLRNQTAHH